MGRRGRIDVEILFGSAVIAAVFSGLISYVISRQQGNLQFLLFMFAVFIEEVLYVLGNKEKNILIMIIALVMYAIGLLMGYFAHINTISKRVCYNMVIYKLRKDYSNIVTGSESSVDKRQGSKKGKNVSNTVSAQ